jgi:hypothetical protein
MGMAEDLLIVLGFGIVMMFMAALLFGRQE